MLKINAIPTIYNDIKFRSRLEARYAVFFDNTNVEYLYEPEGYILPNGKCYLPDFYLPQLDIFIEIKPTNPTQEEIDKAIELVNMTETALIFFWGVPTYKMQFPLILGNLKCLKDESFTRRASSEFDNILYDICEVLQNTHLASKELEYLIANPKYFKKRWNVDVDKFGFQKIDITQLCAYDRLKGVDNHLLKIDKAIRKANSFDFQK